MPDRLLAGEIGKPHGLSGEVYVLPISDDPRRFEPGSRLVHADGRELIVEDVRRHRGASRTLVKFAGYGDRESAETLRGAVYVEAGDLRDLPEGEFWSHEVVGLSVFLLDGQRAGEVIAVQPGTAQDLLVVSTARGERLVPLVSEIVKEVDVEGGCVTIDPPAGLLD